LRVALCCPLMSPVIGQFTATRRGLFVGEIRQPAIAASRTRPAQGQGEQGLSAADVTPVRSGDHPFDVSTADCDPALRSPLIAAAHQYDIVAGSSYSPAIGWFC
jgi:hypothetical protein